ncbi:hypothetical protein ADUPG1_006546 [Aduncisulcus paluster]|uniref:Methyltransferase domain-containing protein n=1 Tax=Aduncisulcus paluster TaxID=2918883 RepID=A0ABQ5KIN2_9EUKA|nr:hypothetical protein ADUPG1_006546 [Aduncisulcus paluster]
MDSKHHAKISPLGAGTSKKQWNAVIYDKQDSVQMIWANGFLKKLFFPPNLDILDVGCGSGRVTKAIYDRFSPRTLQGIDLDKSMVEHARKLFKGMKSVDFLQGDVQAKDALISISPVDVVFSFSCLHWIPNHVAFLSNIIQKLKPTGGKLVLYCAPKISVSDRIDNARKAVLAKRKDWEAKVLEIEKKPHFCPDMSELRQQLVDVGFIPVYMNIVRPEIVFSSRGEFERWIAGWLPHLPYLGDEGELFIRAIVDEYIKLHPLQDDGLHYIDYMLEVIAEKI